MNQTLFNYFYGLAHQSNFLDKAVLFLGGPVFYILIPLLLLIYFLFINRARKMFWSSLLFLSVFGSWLISNIIKTIFKIPRPFFDSTTITPLAHADGFSLPSSHATVFAAISVIVYSYNRRAGIFFWVIAIVVGLSRIIQGVHTPVDIIVGWILGALISYLLVRFYKRFL